MKKNPKKLKKILWTSTCLLVGNAILAFAVGAFVIPCNVLMGGSTGIGILIAKLIPFEVDTSLIVLILNVSLLIAGFFVLGKKFFFTTVVSSILYPILLGLMRRFIPGIDNMTDNHLLAAILGGALLGIAIGLVMRVGASTGGTDVIVLMMHKWTHISVAMLVYIIDVIVLGAQAIFGKPEDLFYGVILIVIETLVLNQVMILGKSQIQLFIVTEKFREVRHELLTKLDTGVTMLKIETGLLLNDQEGIICVIPSRKLYAAKELIHSIDPSAFITVTQIKEVRGRGFTDERIVRLNEERKEE